VILDFDYEASYPMRVGSTFPRDRKQNVVWRKKCQPICNTYFQSLPNTPQKQRPKCKVYLQNLPMQLSTCKMQLIKGKKKVRSDNAQPANLNRVASSLPKPSLGATFLLRYELVKSCSSVRICLTSPFSIRLVPANQHSFPVTDHSEKLTD
jgi:hypothetical protein